MISISKKKLKNYFTVQKVHNVYSLNLSENTKPIYIKRPFVLDENVASLAGLMPDGSLIRDLMRIYFHQKKDLSKIELFNDLVVELFSPKSTVLRKRDKSGQQIYINSKSLAWFFYYILKIPKSDEQMRVPRWIYKSPRKVKIAYLKQAFDMEGTILKKLTEIRFVSKDQLFAKDMKRLLKSLNIECHLTYAPRNKQSSGQYRVSIYRKENFIKFKQIGFDISSLKMRFNSLLEKYGI